MILIFLVSSGLTLGIKYAFKSVGQKYENTIDCNELYDAYSPEEIKDRAVDSWQEFYGDKKSKETFPALLTCFCEK